jgi:hypothetical protein
LAPYRAAQHVSTRTKGYARRTDVDGFFDTLKGAAVANLKRDVYRGGNRNRKLLHPRRCCAVTDLRLARS